MSETIATSKKNIAAKLLKVMGELPYIQKDKTNPHFRYNYASEAAIKRHVQTALLKHGVVFFPVRSVVTDVRLKDKEAVTTISTSYEFIDTDSGEVLAGESLGAGTDAGDKGVFKALTGALKYIMADTFLFETGDDPEDDDPPPARQQQQQTKAPIKEQPKPVQSSGQQQQNAVPQAPARDELAERAKAPGHVSAPPEKIATPKDDDLTKLQAGLPTKEEVKAFTNAAKEFATRNHIQNEQLARFLRHYAKHFHKVADPSKWGNIPKDALDNLQTTHLVDTAAETIKTWQPPQEKQ